MDRPLIGFIGQGFVGKNYADDFEERGYSIVRYSLEETYINNKEKIADCDIVFVAVSANTYPEGFDDRNIRSGLAIIGKGKIAVIKSTLLPGMTKTLQNDFPLITILFSPEFLSKATAAHDAANPFSNIVGLPVDDELHRIAAVYVQNILPSAPFTLTCSSDEAEIVKYAHNIAGFVQVVTFNLIYETAQSLGHDWENIKKALDANPFVSKSYINPVHKTGRGAGGPCFIKDFAAFVNVYEKLVGDKDGLAVLRAFEEKNKKLLKNSNKDIDLLEEVYGPLNK